MSKEFSVRVTKELADWVRQQGPATEVIGRLESAAYCGRLRVAVFDPGPGPERLTVRIPEEALSGIRRLTRSRDNLTALRKLILAGFQARVLPSVPGIPHYPNPKVHNVILGTPVDVCSASVLESPQNRLQEGVNAYQARRVFVFLLWVSAALLILGVLSSRRVPSVPSQRGAKPQDNPWLPEMDSPLSKRVWGYE